MSGTNALMGAGASPNLLQPAAAVTPQAYIGAGASGSAFGAGPLRSGYTYDNLGNYYGPGGGPAAPWDAIDPGTAEGRNYWLGLQQGPEPGPGVVPMDPSQYISQIYQPATANVSHFGGGVQIPLGVTGSQFNPTAENPNFTIGDNGYATLTDAGHANLAQYAQDQLQQVYANAATNRGGLSGFMGSPAGAAAILGFPALVGGAGAALAAGAAAAPEATSGLSSFIANPLTATTGLPSWVSPALKGVDLLRQLLMQRSQSQT